MLLSSGWHAGMRTMGDKSSEIIIEAARRLERHERFAMVTLVKAEGSTPRKEGARMIVGASGALFGTVGGASVEMMAIQAANESLTQNCVKRLELSLNDRNATETGMICGGRVELLIEPFGVGPHLHLFGAGHVAEPTARLALDIGFGVTVYDERSEWASADRFPNCLLKVGNADEAAENLVTTEDDFIAVMTHCHADDYKILVRTMRKPFKYLGLIGSRKKSIEIRKRLADDGFSAEEIARVTCPIGLEVGSHTPIEIAVAIAAQFIQVQHNSN